MKTIPCPISEDELRRLVADEKLTDERIAVRLEGGTVHRVQAWRKRFGIPATPRWERRDFPPLGGRIRSLLVGSMLGDGRLVRRTNATHYSERHCGAQKEYLEWKAGIWGPWAKEVKPVPDKRGYEQFRMETHAHALLNPWQELFYADRGRGWKRLVPRVVDFVDDFALAVWYLDDGCAAWWPDITFGADPASRAVAEAIFEKFGLRPRWQPKKKNTGEFHMEREDTALRFLEIVRPYVPACMARKLGPFGFQGPHFQVRRKMDESRLRELVARGMPVRRIALLLGIGETTVGRWLDKFGIGHPNR